MKRSSNLSMMIHARRVAGLCLPKISAGIYFFQGVYIVSSRAFGRVMYTEEDEVAHLLYSAFLDAESSSHTGNPRYRL